MNDCDGSYVFAWPGCVRARGGVSSGVKGVCADVMRHVCKYDDVLVRGDAVDRAEVCAPVLYVIEDGHRVLKVVVVLAFERG